MDERILINEKRAFVDIRTFSNTIHSQKNKAIMNYTSIVIPITEAGDIAKIKTIIHETLPANEADGNKWEDIKFHFLPNGQLNTSSFQAISIRKRRVSPVRYKGPGSLAEDMLLVEDVETLGDKIKEHLVSN